MATFLKTIRRTVKHWYVPLIVGFFFLFVGIYVVTTPLETVGTLAVLFSISFLFSGVLEIWFSVQNHQELEGWGWYLAGGILSSLIGLLLVSNPEISVMILPFYVGFALLFRSIHALGLAIELKNYGILRWGNLAIASVLGVIFSMILLFNPLVAGISIIMMTSMAFVFSGITSIVLSFQLRKLKRAPAKVRDELKSKIEDLKEEYYEAIESIKKRLD